MCLRASWLISRAADGVVRDPSAFGMTVGLPPSLTAITELVVPRSIPTALAIAASSPVTALRRARSAAINEQRPSCTACHAERPARETCSSGIIRRHHRPITPRPASGIRQGQDGLDVVRPTGVGVFSLVQRYLAGDEIGAAAGRPCRQASPVSPPVTPAGSRLACLPR